MQRLFDIFFSGLALLGLAPLLLPICLLLRCTGEGEVFFLQERVGKGGKKFKVYKFATMLKNSPFIGQGTITVNNDPRILPLGHFLRKTKINELPQLLNILCGDMSIIGPRPLTQRGFDTFAESAQQAVIQVMPGLSGIGSIVFRSEESLLHKQADPRQFYENYISPYKGALEEWYVKNYNIFTYFLLIGLTVWVVLFPKSKAVWRVFGSLPQPGAELAHEFSQC